MKSFLDDLSEFSVSLLKQESEPFSLPIHWVSLANGDADFHDNLIFFGFHQKEPDPVLVVKVPRLVENGWMLRTEYDHLVELWNCIGIEAVNYIPKPYALTPVQERPVLMLSYIPGESLTRLSRKSFWNDRQKVGSLAREAARCLRDLNRLTERRIQPEEASSRDLEGKTETFKQLFPLSMEEDKALASLVETVHETSKTASHQVLIQGDFWHGNMIRDKRRARLMFVDWQFARWSSDVSVDVYFFLLAGALSASGEGSVAERAKRAFRLLSDWRTGVIPDYLAAYGQPNHYVLLPQKYGMLLCCVEKAVRSVLEFGYSHPDDLMWRHLFTELLHWPTEN